MKVLVVGASGFIGRHTIRSLVADGHSVVAMARTPPPAAELVFPFAGDASQPFALECAIATSRCDAVVNLVGINHERDGQSYERMHVHLVRELVRVAEEANVARIVQLSVMSARPHPISAYHDTKFRGDELVMRARVPWTILRPAIVFGDDDQFTTRLRAQLKMRVAPLPDGGTARHALVHVDDVASACARVLALPETIGRILPLSGARVLSYRAILRELSQDLEKKPIEIPLPAALLRLVAHALASLHEPPLTTAQLTMLVEGMAEDTQPSWALLGIDPRGFAPAGLLPRT